MKYNLTDYGLIAFCVLTLGAGQLLFKYVGLNAGRIPDMLANPRIVTALITAIALYATSTAVWIFVLKRVPLSYAYLFMALGFLIVPIAAIYFFSEPISARFFIGAAVVVVGLLIAVT
jgi:drug/metabolite transporter (DMT)-like permease